MYSVDAKDRVVTLKDVPQSSIGAPLPVVLANEHSLFLAYYLEVSEPEWDGKAIRIVDHRTSEEPAAVIEFKNAYAHLFGPPNDEAFSGHPLASRGLRPYSSFVIENSSWIRSMERMNSVHPNHSPRMFADYRHFVIAFHDSTFECVAKGYSIEKSFGPLSRVLDIIKDRLGRLS